MLCLNTLFYQYELVDHKTIIFRNIKQNLTKVRTMGTVREQYDLKVTPYAWEHLVKAAPIRPLRRLNDWLIFSQEINYSWFVVYNGVIYDYIR